jgi:hypothetical protein
VVCTLGDVVTMLAEVPRVVLGNWDEVVDADVSGLVTAEEDVTIALEPLVTADDEVGAADGEVKAEVLGEVAGSVGMEEEPTLDSVFALDGLVVGTSTEDDGSEVMAAAELDVVGASTVDGDVVSTEDEVSGKVTTADDVVKSTAALLVGDTSIEVDSRVGSTGELCVVGTSADVETGSSAVVEGASEVTSVVGSSEMAGVSSPSEEVGTMTQTTTSQSVDVGASVSSAGGSAEMVSMSGRGVDTVLTGSSGLSSRLSLAWGNSNMAREDDEPFILRHGCADADGVGVRLVNPDDGVSQ